MDLNLLNAANALRLPQFKNKHGDKAHSEPDGSDWSPRMWLVALMGELGELVDANEIRDPQQIADEAADVQTYLDIYCQRALDGFDVDNHQTVEYGLIRLIHSVGKLCEMHKKHIRGDMNRHDYTLRMSTVIRALSSEAQALNALDIDAGHDSLPAITAGGVNLSYATRKKFNRVSERVGSDVFLTETRVVRHNPGETE